MSDIIKMPPKINPRSTGRSRSASIPLNFLDSYSLLQSKKGLVPQSSQAYTVAGSVEKPPRRPPSPLPCFRSNTHSTLRGVDHSESSSNHRSPDAVSRRPEFTTMNESHSSKLWLQSKKFDPHHGRSYSFRTMRRPTPQQLAEEEHFRPRGATMPSDSLSYLRERRQQRLRERSTSPNLSPLDHLEDSDEFYRLRSFSITSKGGIVNRGDQIRQRSRSNNSMASSYPSCASTATSCSSGPGTCCTHLKVLVLGAVGVGKSCIVTQFMSSEYMNAYDTSQDEEPEKTVFLLLDGEEYELTMTLVDQQTFGSFTDFEEDTIGTADAYLVVYSVTDRVTFENAVDILFKLREQGYTAKRAVILVGNKSDLVRSRTVLTEEGKSVAISYECKFMETSAVISHKTDDLLVGIVSQIRLKNQQLKDFNHFSPPSKGRKSRSKGSLYGTGRRAKEFLNKLLGKESYKSKSCDNLHVL